MLQSGIKQIAFFSISFSLAERLLLLPQAFAYSLRASQMAQYGRDRDRLFRMTGLAATYMMMVSLPLLLGAACISGPIVRILYGPQYLPAISVFALVAVFAIPKGILGPAQTLLYSMEELGFLLKWGCLCGALNILLDIVLIPNHAAFGAAIANGTAQTMAAAGIWWYAIRCHPLGLQPKILLKLTAASLGMSILVLEQPWSAPEPVVCVEEKSVTLHEAVRASLPMKPGHVAKRDHAYKRCGTANVFCRVEGKAGIHFTWVTANRSSPEFAAYLRQIAGHRPSDTLEACEVALRRYTSSTLSM